MLTYAPCDDGITHINIYSSGKTELGQHLSHFAYAPFEHPDFGHFNCVEGFWYYLSTGCQRDEFHYLTGYKAKLLGRRLPRILRDDFEQRIREANRCKILQHPELLEVFIASTLPFDHYYLMTNQCFQVRPNNVTWLVPMFEALRTELRGAHGTAPSAPDLCHGS